MIKVMYFTITSLKLSSVAFHRVCTWESRLLEGRISFCIYYEISRNSADFKRRHQIRPLIICYAEMFSVNIGDHILPSAFRRGFSCDIQVKNVFVFQFFFHGDHSLVGHSARSAPSCPEVNQQYVSAEFGDDSRKEFLRLLLSRFH